MRGGPSTSSRQAAERRVVIVACSAHALHDGYADALYYLLFPLWRAEFGLTYAFVGVMRALYSGSLAALQRPSASLADRVGGRLVLVGGTVLVGAAWMVAGASSWFAPLLVALVVGGIGASTQHPIASSAVASASEGIRSRARLATYNFSGDLGKMAVPALTAALLTVWPWRPTMLLLGAIAVAASTGMLLLPRGRGASPSTTPETPATTDATPGGRARRGFGTLLAIGIVDSATRMGFLTFLPFLLTAKGASVAVLGLALTLVFAGGAAGKLVCGYLGARLGVIATVFLTEGLTAATILALLPLSLQLSLVLLPLVGVCLNGTSSVLYGTVPELVGPEQRTRAFGVFYTGTIGAGAVAPIVYGRIGDAASIPTLLALVALLVLVTLPLAWRLRAPLAAGAATALGPAA